MGIDPGKEGAFVILDENSKVLEMIPMPLIGREYDVLGIREIITRHKIARAGLENPQVIPAIGKSAVASLSHCVGLIEGVLIGCEVPFVKIRPKEWQKECWKHVKLQKKAAGGNDTKATSALAAINLWPSVNFRITSTGRPSKNIHDGLTDASLIAEYVRRNF